MNACICEKMSAPAQLVAAGGVADTYSGGTDVTKGIGVAESNRRRARPAIERFRAKYEVDAATGCWVWTAARKENRLRSLWSRRSNRR